MAAGTKPNRTWSTPPCPWEPAKLRPKNRASRATRRLNLRRACQYDGPAVCRLYVTPAKGEGSSETKPEHVDFPRTPTTAAAILLPETNMIQRALIAACPVLCVACDGGSGTAKSTGETVVLIFVDTLRADHLGTYGYAQPTSPTIDALAASGVKFTSAYAASPWTYSSTASLVTGLYPAGHGAIMPGIAKDQGANPSVSALSPGFETMPERFAAAGFRTALFASNGYLASGNEQGFQTYMNTWHYPAKGQVERALTWLNSVPAETSAFLMVHFIDVHSPNRPTDESVRIFPALAALTAPEREAAAKFRIPLDTSPGGIDATTLARRMGTYDASIRDVDSSVADLLRGVGALRKHPLVIFTADHGESFGDHQQLERSLYSDPRKVGGVGHGQAFFDEVVRVPLIISQPGVVSPSTVNDRVSLIDVLPTVLDLLGMPPVEDADGRSLRPLLKGQSVPVLPLFFDSVCFGRDKQGILDGRWKFTQSDSEPDLLVDIEADPAEQTNLAAAHPEEVRALRQKISEALALSSARGAPYRSAAPAIHTPDEAERAQLIELGYIE